MWFISFYYNLDMFSLVECAFTYYRISEQAEDKPFQLICLIIVLCISEYQGGWVKNYLNKRSTCHRTRVVSATTLIYGYVPVNETECCSMFNNTILCMCRTVTFSYYFQHAATKG